MTAGTEVSGTRTGINLMFAESLLTHPSHTDSLVDKGDPVLLTSGLVHGVALQSASASSDLITIATGGIWNLTVVEGETADHVAGEPVYFVTATGVINTSNSSANHFGWLMAPLASGVTGVRPVLVDYGRLS
jgi:hypothetical protein